MSVWGDGPPAGHWPDLDRASGSSGPLLDALNSAADLAGELRNIIAHDGALASIYEYAHLLAGYLERIVTPDSDGRVDGSLVLALQLAKDLVYVLGRDLENDFALDRNPALLRADDLVGTLKGAHERALGLDRVSRPADATHVRQSTAACVAPSARRLLAVAARLLPAADRARYSEEYRSELWDIAHAGAGRRQQFHYATRQTLRLAQLRGAVLPPRRRNASP